MYGKKSSTVARWLPGEAREGGRSRTWVYLLILTGISVAARLPQLLSPNLLLDGDESLIGLMAKHVAEGRSLAIFVYGQHYGLSIIETAAGALSFLLFGMGAIPLKVAMLALWTLGVLFMFLALSRMIGAWRSFWIMAVFLVTPAWAATSMTAWGGYTTAFTVTSVLVWLLVSGLPHDGIVRWLIAGALTSVIYLARPLWLPGLLPIVAVVLFASQRRLSLGISYVGGAAAVMAVIKLLTVDSLNVWEGPALGNWALLETLPGAARQVYVNLTGAYFLGGMREPPGPASELLARLWCVLLLLVVPAQVYRIVTRRYCVLSHLLFLAVCASLITPWLLFFVRDARYLLPLGAPLVVLAGVELLDFVDRGIVPRRVAIAATTAALVLGSMSMYEFRKFNHLWVNPPNALAEAERMHRVIFYLQAKGIRHVFSMNGLLDSQLVFYSEERVLARWTPWRVRYPPVHPLGQSSAGSWDDGRPRGLYRHERRTWLLERASLHRRDCQARAASGIHRHCG